MATKRQKSAAVQLVPDGPVDDAPTVEAAEDAAAVLDDAGTPEATADAGDATETATLPAVRPSVARGGFLRRGRRAPEGEDLSGRIRELEHEVAELRARKDLKDLDDAEMARLAGRTAAVIVTSARQRQLALLAEAENVLAGVADQASTIIESAHADATRSRDEADLYDAATRESADRYATDVRAEADRYRDRVTSEADSVAAATTGRVEAEIRGLLDDADRRVAEARAEADRIEGTARDLAAQIEGSARAEADRILHDATSQQEAMIGLVETNRRRVSSLVRDSELVQREASAAFDAVNRLVEDAMTALSSTFDAARRVAGKLDRLDLTPPQAASDVATEGEGPAAKAG